MLSMTGYGVGEAPHRNGRIIVEVRAVNHRYLDVRVRLPNDSGDISPMIESYIRKRLERGRVEVLIRPEGDAIPSLVLDEKKARDAYRQLVLLRDELCPNEPVPLSLLSSVPELFSINIAVPYADNVRETVGTAMAAACDQVLQMRAREGQALAEDLRARLGNLLGIIESVRTRAPVVIELFHARLKERIDSLVKAHEGAVDKARLHQEVALFAERTDIAEELTRFICHCEHFTELLDDKPTGPTGRRLDFLLQEMAREVNTLGAKSADVEISRAVVELKAELERMREQVQNVV